jgi:hypothetical protein
MSTSGVAQAAESITINIIIIIIIIVVTAGAF